MKTVGMFFSLLFVSVSVFIFCFADVNNTELSKNKQPNNGLVYDNNEAVSQL